MRTASPGRYHGASARCMVTVWRSASTRCTTTWECGADYRAGPGLRRSPVETTNVALLTGTACRSQPEWKRCASRLPDHPKRSHDYAVTLLTWSIRWHPKNRRRGAG